MQITVNDASVLRIVEIVDGKEVDITPQPKPVKAPPAPPAKQKEVTKDDQNKA